MKNFKTASLVAALVLLGSVAGFSQESETKVVDEVVAQVNDGVITLSSVNREIKDAVDSLVQQGKTKEEAEKIVEEKRGELIAGMINDELIVQKGKELGVDQDVQASVNARFLQIMKQQNVKTLDTLYKMMQDQGVDPQELREQWRRQATREEVIQRDVQYKLYWGPNDEKIKAYFEKNKGKFTTPETVTLSEIFLSFAGRDPANVREKAKQLLAQLRSGADFAKAVADNSDRPDAAKNNGKVDTFNVKDLDPKFGKAIEGLKAGSYTDLVETDDVGVDILRVDDRTAASSESKYDEKAVRSAMLAEAMPDAQKKYMEKLREEAYVKINETYRPLVSPILFAEERSEKNPDKVEKSDKPSKP
ncbi:MAG: peptidylprolyl isomerase [Pyrinomonadaceae bacterium]